MKEKIIGVLLAIGSLYFFYWLLGELVSRFEAWWVVPTGVILVMAAAICWGLAVLLIIGQIKIK